MMIHLLPGRAGGRSPRHRHQHQPPPRTCQTSVMAPAPIRDGLISVEGLRPGRSRDPIPPAASSSHNLFVEKLPLLPRSQRPPRSSTHRRRLHRKLSCLRWVRGRSPGPRCRCSPGRCIKELRLQRGNE